MLSRNPSSNPLPLPDLNERVTTLVHDAPMARHLLLLDQDGVLADFDGALDEVLRDLGHDPTLLERTAWDYAKDVERHFGIDAVRALDDAWRAPGFFKRLDVIDGAIEAVEELLALGFDVAVCTAPSSENPTCASDKLWWVDHHFPSLAGNVVLATDKTLVHGDLLIDDRPWISGLRRPTWQHLRFATKDQGPFADELSIDSWSEWRTIADLLDTGLVAA